MDPVSNTTSATLPNHTRRYNCRRVASDGAAGESIPQLQSGNLRHPSSTPAPEVHGLQSKYCQDPLVFAPPDLLPVNNAARMKSTRSVQKRRRIALTTDRRKGSRIGPLTRIMRPFARFPEKASIGNWRAVEASVNSASALRGAGFRTLQIGKLAAAMSPNRGGGGAGTLKRLPPCSGAPGLPGNNGEREGLSRVAANTKIIQVALFLKSNSDLTVSHSS